MMDDSLVQSVWPVSTWLLCNSKQTRLSTFELPSHSRMTSLHFYGAPLFLVDAATVCPVFHFVNVIIPSVFFWDMNIQLFSDGGRHADNVHLFHTFTCAAQQPLPPEFMGDDVDVYISDRSRNISLLMINICRQMKKSVTYRVQTSHQEWKKKSKMMWLCVKWATW